MSRPPKLPLLLLRLLAGRQILEEIEGDLYEDFLDNLESKGPRRAKAIYIWTALRSVRPYILLHNKENRKPKFIDMFYYQIKMAFRAFRKSPSHTFINIFGLALGLAGSLVILLFLIDDKIKDDFLENSDRIYRLESTSKRNGLINRSVKLHSSLMPAISPNIPEIEAYTRMSLGSETVVFEKSGNKEVLNQTFLSADPGFFKVFSFEIIEGNPQNILSRHNVAVITESAAERIFGNTDPIGQQIKLAKPDQFSKDTNLEIVGLMKDPPGNSSIQFDFVKPMSTVTGQNEKVSFGRNFYISLPIYVLLTNGSQPESVTKKILPELKKHTESDQHLAAQYALKNVHALKYDTEVTDSIIATTDKRIINMFAIVAILIISLAIINYINLTSARATLRGREVGVRKVTGATQRGLLGQFLLESLLTCLIALPFAIIIVQLTIPAFEEILGDKLFFDYSSNPSFLLKILVFVVSLGLIAGVYPAILLSKHKFAGVLRGRVEHSRNGVLLRKTLVIFQFVFSIALLAGIAFIQSQLNFIKDTSLKYNPDRVLVLNGTSAQFRKNYQTIKNQIQQIPGVLQVSIAGQVPGDQFFGETRSPQFPFPFKRFIVDHDYLDIFGIDIKAGVTFNPLLDSAASHVIVNETFANAMEGDLLNSSDYKFHGRNKSKIIGISEDFHFESLHNQVAPVVLTPVESFPWVSKAIIKLETSQVAQVISGLEQMWKEIYPEQTLNYQFLDDRLDRLYQAEFKMAEIFKIFTILAIVISCLGLLGLSTHTAQVKTKEISVRKVLGASVGQIIQLLAKQTYLLVSIAAIIAFPIAYYFVDQWLQNFAYSIDLSILTFLSIIGLCFLITAITIGFQTIKTARTNPADALRND